jgi:hypothetical protein
MNDHTKDRHAHQAQVIQLQPRTDLHRVFPEYPEPRREPTTRLDRLLVAMATALFVACVVALIGWGWQELSRVDWSALVSIDWRPS